MFSGRLFKSRRGLGVGFGDTPEVLATTLMEGIIVYHLAVMLNSAMIQENIARCVQSAPTLSVVSSGIAHITEATRVANAVAIQARDPKKTICVGAVTISNNGYVPIQNIPFANSNPSATAYAAKYDANTEAATNVPAGICNLTDVNIFGELGSIDKGDYTVVTAVVESDEGPSIVAASFFAPQVSSGPKKPPEVVTGVPTGVIY